MEFGLLLLFVNNSAMITGVQISLQDSAFNRFMYISRNRIVESQGNSNFNLGGKQHTVFHSSCTISHFGQEYTRVPISTEKPNF